MKPRKTPRREPLKSLHNSNKRSAKASPQQVPKFSIDLGSLAGERHTGQTETGFRKEEATGEKLRTS